MSLKKIISSPNITIDISKGPKDSEEPKLETPFQYILERVSIQVDGDLLEKNPLHKYVQQNPKHTWETLLTAITDARDIEAKKAYFDTLIHKHWSQVSKFSYQFCKLSKVHLASHLSPNSPISTEGFDRWSPLHIFVYLHDHLVQYKTLKDHLKNLIQTILNSGRNLNATNATGQKAVDLCSSPELIEMFKTVGQSPNPPETIEVPEAMVQWRMLGGINLGKDLVQQIKTFRAANPLVQVIINNILDEIETCIGDYIDDKVWKTLARPEIEEVLNMVLPFKKGSIPTVIQKAVFPDYAKNPVKTENDPRDGIFHYTWGDTRKSKGGFTLFVTHDENWTPAIAFIGQHNQKEASKKHNLNVYHVRTSFIETFTPTMFDTTNPNKTNTK